MGLLSEQSIRITLVSVVSCVSFCVQNSCVLGENLLSFFALVGNLELGSHLAVVSVR